MSPTRKTLSLLLALLALLPLAACSDPGASPGPDTTATETGAETASEPSDDPDTRDFVSRFGDTAAAEAWVKANIVDSDRPPITFTVGTRSSADLVFTKTVGEITTVTDYPDSGDPAQRTVQTIVYRCESENLQVDLTLTRYPGFPVVEYDAFLTNLSSDRTEEIRNLCSLNADLGAVGQDPVTLHYNQGSHGNEETEYQPFSRKITAAATKLHNKGGMPTSTFLPFFNAEYGSGGVILGINWQGNWFSEFQLREGVLHTRAGQNGLMSVLLGNERFKLPGTVLLFYRNGDRQFGQNVWRRWILRHNLMRYTGRRDYRQNVFVCSPIQGAEQDLAEIAAFAETGLADRYNCVFEIDAGWYGPGGYTPSSWVGNVGNWYPSTAYGEDGLKRISDACHEAGMSFCLWMEPERLFSSSKSAPILGDSAIYLDYQGQFLTYEQAAVSGSVQGLINYGTQAAQDFVVDLVTRTVKEYGLDVYRQDFNVENDTYWKAYDSYEGAALDAMRRGATENHACEGYVNAWRRIEEACHGLIFDACAGGGRRYDLETLRFGFLHTKSDYNSEVMSQQCQNFGVSSWHIFTGTGFADPSSLYDVRSRLTLSIGIGISGAGALEGALAEWNAVGDDLYGDYYQLSDYSLAPDAAIAMQFCRYETDSGLLTAFLRVGGTYDLKAKALDPDADYLVRSADDPDAARVMTGRDLMEEGYPLSAPEGLPAAFRIRYERVDGPAQP